VTILVSGSFAYDTVMRFPGRFADHILPERVHALSVAFDVERLERSYGGCAGNIVYNLQALGAPVVPVGTVGEDFAPYRARLASWGVTTAFLHEVPGFTAQAYVLTDRDDNQITAFHAGAMRASGAVALPALDPKPRLAIVAPDAREGMLRRARELAEARVPYVLDPGQALPLFSAEELQSLVAGARALALNDYEEALLTERTGWSTEAIARRLEAVVVTLGARGARLHRGGSVETVPAVPPERVVDPTGCGDAHRAGLLWALHAGWSWTRAVRFASLLGSVKVAHAGTQNHPLAWDDLEDRYARAFGELLERAEAIAPRA
jgi:adenosine kinase